MVVPGGYAHFIQYCGVYMQGDIEPAGFVHHTHGKKLGGPAEVGKTKGIGLFKADHIVSVGICGCSGSTTAEYRYAVQWMGPVHIKYGPVNGDLLGGYPECTNGEKGKYNRFPEICVEKNQTVFFNRTKIFKPNAQRLTLNISRSSPVEALAKAGNASHFYHYAS